MLKTEVGTKRRILYIESNTDGTIGGSYYSLLYLLEGLNKELYEPHVLFCQDNILVPRFKEVAEEVIVHNYDPSGSNPFNSWKAIPRFMKHIVLKQLELRKIIKRVRPDLVHLNNTYAANHEWMLACRLNNIRIVAHDRGTRPPSTWQTRVFIRFLEATISVSEAYKNIVIEQGLKPKRIRRVYNGLDAEKLKKYRSIQDRRKVRESLGINENTILVGMVGNIDYWKGQLVFIKAMDILVKENRDIHGVIIGKTAIGAESYEQEIQQFLNDKKITGKVNLLGFRQDIPQLLNAMDIFVHASVEPEPFGRVILEAMAMAKPIVATKSGGTLEQIEHEHSGLLVPMGDHQSMANAIKKYTTDMKWANSIGDNALERLNGFFSIANMVKGVEDVYEEIFDSRK